MPESRVVECPDRLMQIVADLGGRVVNVRELTEYKRYRNRVAFLSCFDERFQKATAEFIAYLIASSQKFDRFEALRLPLPGAGLPIINGIVPGADWLEGGLFQWAFEGQMAGVCYIIAHFDCGAFGGSQKFGYDYDTEMRHWEDQLRKAKININRRYPGVIIKAYVLSVNERLDDNQAMFKFQPVLETEGEVVIIQSSYTEHHVAKRFLAACPDTIIRKVTHDQFGGEMHFRLNVPGGMLYFSQTDDYEMVKYLLDVPLNHCDIEELLLLSHPNCTLSSFHAFPHGEADKLKYFLREGNKARHVIRDLFPHRSDLNVRPIFGHTFPDHNRKLIAYIES